MVVIDKNLLAQIEDIKILLGNMLVSYIKKTQFIQNVLSGLCTCNLRIAVLMIIFIVWIYAQLTKVS